MKTKKPKPAVSPLAYKLILSAGITLLLISIHYSYFSPAGYGDWMLAWAICWARWRRWSTV